MRWNFSHLVHIPKSKCFQLDSAIQPHFRKERGLDRCRRLLSSNSILRQLAMFGDEIVSEEISSSYDHEESLYAAGLYIDELRQVDADS